MTLGSALTARPLKDLSPESPGLRDQGPQAGPGCSGTARAGGHRLAWAAATRW